MKTCEEYQMDASALLDGELETSEIADTVGHLAKCETCLAVFKAYKTLQHNIDTVVKKPEVPAEIWTAIAKARPKEKKPLVIPFKIAALKIVAAAAVLIMMFTLGYNFNRPSPEQLVSDDQNSPIVLASDRGNMTDERFRALAREILSADPDYIRKMYIILHTLEFEGSDSDLKTLPENKSPEALRIGYAQERANETEKLISR